MDNLPVTYESLVRMVPPQAIRDDDHCEETIAVIDRLMTVPKLSHDQIAYMETLVQLVQVYESEHHPILASRAEEEGLVATRYTLPVDKPLCRPFNGGLALLTDDVNIELRNSEDGLWAVTAGGRCCLNTDGEMEVEGLPSGRSDDFLARTRFPLDDAIARAKAFIGRHTEYHPRSRRPE